MEKDKYIYIISFMYVLIYQRKPWLCLMNRFNFLKLMQHFNALNFNQKEKEKKKEKNVLKLFGTRVTLQNISKINLCIFTNY